MTALSTTEARTRWADARDAEVHAWLELAGYAQAQADAASTRFGLDTPLAARSNVRVLTDTAVEASRAARAAHTNLRMAEGKWKA